jgi:hypothetical protein
MKVAIKNIDTSRDSEIIQIFESLGGENTDKLIGCNHNYYYYINILGKISISDKKYLIKNEYVCFDSIDEYVRSIIPLHLSNITTDELKTLWTSNIINYNDI